MAGQDDASVSQPDGDYVDWTDAASRRGAGRLEFMRLVRTRFAEIADPSPRRLTFSFAVFGAPWKCEWLDGGARFLGRYAEDGPDSIDAALRRTRAIVSDFFVAGYQPDRGTGWRGAQAGRGSEQVRVYDVEPIVLCVERERDIDRSFSPHWFEGTVAAAIHLASAVLPRRHPDLAAFATIWRLSNPAGVALGISDQFDKRRDFEAPSPFDDVLSAVEPVRSLTHGASDFAKKQVAQYLRTVRSRYGVPDTFRERR